MSIFRSSRKAELQEMMEKYAKAEAGRSSAEKAKADIEAGVKKLREVQELIVDDILSLKTAQAKYVGNEYRDYATAVQAISDKFNGKAEWGCLQVATIIELRSAFILGDGIKVSHKTDEKAEAQKELDWTKAFLAYNGLDGEMAQELAKEAEIEGKVCLRLLWEPGPFRGFPGMPSVRYISWSSRKYVVEADTDDYLWYKRLTWPAGSGYSSGNVPEAEFVYKKFGGRINAPNEAQPKVMKCLTQVDRLDRALRDLREIEHLFASPTPDFQTETPEQATRLLGFLKEKNWRIGKAIAHVGQFRLVGPDMAGVETLIKEIELNVKMISGTTGIPIHYLGLLDLLHNRATGDNTRELVMAATTRERSTWQAAYQELIEKAMELYNSETGEGQKSTKLDPTKVKVEIPLISQEHWDHIEKVLIPAALGNIISKDHVAAQIPGVDIEAEAKKREEAEAKELKQAELDFERIKAANENDRIDEGGPAVKGKPN